MILVDSPDYEKARLSIKDYKAIVVTTNNIMVAMCKKGECEAVCRKELQIFPKNSSRNLL